MNFGFTSHHNYSYMQLIDYHARFYSPTLGRFIQPDSLIPDLAKSQAWNRYSYVLNNPVKYTDPGGHYPLCIEGVECFTLPGYTGGGKWGFNASKNGGIKYQKPKIISRSEWGAHDPGSFGNQNPSAPKYEGHVDEKLDGYKPYEGNLAEIYYFITIHHEGDDETHNVLAVQEAEMNSGFYDIGYHYIIDSGGTIYEGRDIGVRGNHAYPNTGNLGILWLGDFNPGYDLSDPYGRTGVDPTDDPGPTTSQFNATVDLVLWLDQSFGIDNLYGHSDVPGGLSTSCPGESALPFVEKLKLLIQ